MKKISSSASKYNFTKKRYIQQLEENPNDETAFNMLDVLNALQEEEKDRLNEIEWQKNNLEYDLRTTDWILDKVRSSDSYSQNLYAALCNNEFIKRDTWSIIKDDKWSCSWRYAGGIIADMREEGDYMDWYCSGTSSESSSTVPESTVTEEVESDLFNLGWLIIKDNE